jgi:hypothetical protein
MQVNCTTFIMKNQRGRPKLGTQNAKGVLMAVRFTPREAKQIDRAARSARLTKSDWVRRGLLALAAENKEAA